MGQESNKEIDRSAESVDPMRSLELGQWGHVFQHAEWGVVIGRGDSTCLDFVTPAFARMHGYTVAELRGRPICDVFAPSFREQVPEIIRCAHEHGHYSCEADHIRKDGTIFPVQLDVTAVQDSNGTVLYRAVYVQDITVRRQAEQALRRSENLARERLAELEHVYATAPVGLCLLDTNLRFIRINEPLAAFHGVPVANHIGHTLREAIPEVAERGEALCRAVLESGEPILGRELHGVTSARPSMVVLASVYPLKSGDGAIEAISVVIQDITERKRAEQAIRESEERLSRILDSAMDAIITIDASRIIRVFNRAAETIFQCQSQDAVGSSMDRFMSRRFQEVVASAAKSGSESEQPAGSLWVPQGLTGFRASGEEFPVEATISRVETDKENLFTIILRDINDRARAEAALERLQAEVVYLREEARQDLEFGEIIGESPAIQDVLESIRHVANTDSTVLITGETGTGKELVAAAIHDTSDRSDKPLVKVNCAALPGGLVESELFGHEKGAFTGALTKKIGRFELADGGTILLDEIGDLPVELQAKLLRVLQEGEFERVGGAETRRVDVRVVAATNKDLATEVQSGKFRSDLFYRLNVFPISVPPLRERREDISVLARHFAMRIASRLGKRVDSIPRIALNVLQAYGWPGNVRELQNVIERAVILTKSGSLEVGAWPAPSVPATDSDDSVRLEDVERRHILTILEQVGWRVSGSNGAADILGIKPTTLHARMKKLGIARPQ